MHCSSLLKIAYMFHISPLPFLLKGTDRLAGFSVVGGRDQPHMPNPGAFIVTAVDVGSPASGVLQ